MDWTTLNPSFFYYGWEPKVVVALVDTPEALSVPRPYRTRDAVLPDPERGDRHFQQVFLDRPIELASLPPLAEVVRAWAIPEGSVCQLFPTAGTDVAQVAGNWCALFERRDASPQTETHDVYLASEVADDCHTILQFLEGEVALWEAICRFRPGRDSEYQVNRVREALTLGQVVIDRFFGNGARSYGVAINALTDVIRRTMVTEKLWALGPLRGP